MSGITALGLISAAWTLENTAEKFNMICSQAFIHRTGGQVPGLRWLMDAYKASFRTRPLENALISAFTSGQPLFGGRRPRQIQGLDVKVAVVASTQTGRKELLTNFNRSPASTCKHHQLAQKIKIGAAVLTIRSAISSAPSRTAISGVQDLGSVICSWKKCL
jgi:hypothetical protein